VGSGTAALDERRDGRAPRQRPPRAPERYAWRDLGSAAGVLTLLRLPLAAAFAAVASRPLWAMLVLLAAGVSDVLDGWCARRFHQQTRTGAVADAVMDKVFDGCAYIERSADARARFASGARAYSEVMHAHITRETDVLFAIAEAVLDAKDDEKLVRAFELRDHDILGPGEHERLETRLRALTHKWAA
jgi:hypothetical protein